MDYRQSIFFIDDTLTMFCPKNEGDTIYYDASVEMVIDMLSGKNSFPDWFNTVTIFRGTKMIKIESKEDCALKLEELRQNQNIGFGEMVPFWVKMIGKAKRKDRDIYIFSSRVDKSFMKWAFRRPVKPVVFDLVERPNEKITDTRSVEERIDSLPVSKIGKLFHSHQIQNLKTFVHFGFKCVGEAHFELTEGAKNVKASIKSIKVCGSSTITKVDGFPVAAIGTFTPEPAEGFHDEPELKKLTKKQAREKAKSAAENIDNFVFLHDAIETMTLAENESIVFIGKAATRYSDEFFPAVIKSVNTYIPIEEPIVEEPKPEDADANKESDSKQDADEEKSSSKKKRTEEVRIHTMDDSDIEDVERIPLDEYEEVMEAKVASDAAEQEKNEDGVMTEVDNEKDSKTREKPEFKSYFEVQILNIPWKEFMVYAQVKELVLPEKRAKKMEKIHPPLKEDDFISHHSSEAMSVLVYRMIRALRKLPDRTAIYQKETENMSRMITSSESRCYGLMFAKLLRREAQHLSYSQIHIAEETAKHFVKTAIRYK